MKGAPFLSFTSTEGKTGRLHEGRAVGASPRRPHNHPCLHAHRAANCTSSDPSETQETVSLKSCILQGELVLFSFRMSPPHKEEFCGRMERKTLISVKHVISLLFRGSPTMLTGMDRMANINVPCEIYSSELQRVGQRAHPMRLETVMALGGFAFHPRPQVHFLPLSFHVFQCL